VVSYDVVDDGRRARLSKFLLGHLDRVQKSVFEGEIQESKLEELREGIEKRIDQTEDSVRVYTLCARCEGLTEVIGTGIYIEPEPGDIVF
jgi:CRISPR-associated protein Cas2